MEVEVDMSNKNVAVVGANIEQTPFDVAQVGATNAGTPASKTFVYEGVTYNNIISTTVVKRYIYDEDGHLKETIDVEVPEKFLIGDKEYRSVHSYDGMTAKELALCKIKVMKPSGSVSNKNRAENSDEETAQTIAYILFSLALASRDSSGNFVSAIEIPINGARIKKMSNSPEPFLSLDGFRVNGRTQDGEQRQVWINIVDLNDAQKAYLTRYAMKEIAKWKEDTTREEAI
jgi:hypothetical protein